MKVTKKDDLIVLVNELGMEVTLSSYGAGIYDIRLPDKNGELKSIVVRPENYQAYKSSKSYFGKTLGFNAGRLKDSKLFLNDKEYLVKSPSNDALHGGVNGLSFQYFENIVKSKNEHEYTVIFRHAAKHLSDDLPGNRKVGVIYTFGRKQNKLSIEYQVETDVNTVANLSNHVYFNLNGGGSILNHELMIKASHYVKLDKKLIGVEVKPVNETMDFRVSKPIGTHINDLEIRKIAQGYDHPWILDEHTLDEPVAILKNEEHQVNIYTTYPALVFYSGNYLPDVPTNNGKITYHECVALEPQCVPNAINNPLGQSETGLLLADESSIHKIIFTFE